jgi:DNA polymerase I-like protein with 3'-5' exonuclease and polymerase domains
MQSFRTIPEWVTLEHEVATILTQQEIHGWYFNQEAAREFELDLREELQTITQALERKYPNVPGIEFTPKRDNKTRGYVAGATFTKLKDLNPYSRDHLAWILTTYDGFDPNGTQTKSGKLVIDETTLKNHGTGLALEMLRVLEIGKMLGMISEGANAWQKLCTSASRIHHHCSVATSTHRCAHRNPNLGQVPSDERAPGQVMVGADLSGIELRMLSHYLARYDPYFGDNLLNGDIHQANADKIGITRKLVKNVTYAFLYGAGDVKIGLTYDPLLSNARAKSKGKEIREAFVAAIPGLADLLAATKAASDRGYVKAIDGRKIKLSSPHVALNYLLQGSAGVIAKRWMVMSHANPFCCNQLAFVHDELQYECDPEHAEVLKSHLETKATEAGAYYNLRIPLAAEGKIGSSWADVH